MRKGSRLKSRFHALAFLLHTIFCRGSAMQKDNPLLKALSEIPNDYDESSVSFEFEMMVLSEVIGLSLIHI